MPMRLYRLHEIHARLDESIRRELKRKRPDGLRLLRLKKMKLHAKDLIHRLVRAPRRAG